VNLASLGAAGVRRRAKTSRVAGWLRIDPTFDPIRKHPGFGRLIDRAT
jgi:hypothetical protein